ncbi:hypothetical protein ABBQ38_013954 [Trebouxia sp. C0009 RCD-2024]
MRLCRTVSTVLSNASHDPVIVNCFLKNVFHTGIVCSFRHKLACSVHMWALLKTEHLNPNLLPISDIQKHTTSGPQQLLLRYDNGGFLENAGDRGDCQGSIVKALASYRLLNQCIKS